MAASNTVFMVVLREQQQQQNKQIRKPAWRQAGKQTV